MRSAPEVGLGIRGEMKTIWQDVSMRRFVVPLHFDHFNLRKDLIEHCNLC